MAFDLRTNNLTGLSVIDQPAGVLATNETYIETYDYLMQYQPELIPQLHMRNGKGSILGFMRITSSEGTYKADTIQHMEEGRLHNVLKNVVLTVISNTFTSPTPHNLRPKDVVLISDGVVERQATVQSITSTTAFVATNDETGAFGFSGNVTVLADFSNRHAKGSEQFEDGRNWNPTPVVNYTHTIKETYERAKSQFVTNEWVQTSSGPRWVNHEMERTSTLFDNKGELTNIFHRRVTDASATGVIVGAGGAKGVKGAVQQIEERGNIGNEYITTLTHLSNIARRAKQQGTCRAFTVWSDHQQMAYFRIMMSGLNSSYVNGANYGVFQNSMNMALKLDFSSVLVDGVTFHFTPWTLLEDPTLMGATNFMATNLACLIVPAGETYVMEEGNTLTKPYFTFRHRSEGNINRKKDISIYGLNAPHPQRKDVVTIDYLSEMTNQVIGANNFFVVRRGVFYS